MTLTGAPLYIKETLHLRILICFSYLYESGQYSQNLFNLCHFVIFAAVEWFSFLHHLIALEALGLPLWNAASNPDWPRRTCWQMLAMSEPLEAQKVDARLLNLTAFMSSLGSPECSTWSSMSTLTRTRNLGLRLGIDKEGCVSPNEEGWGRGRTGDEPWHSHGIARKCLWISRAGSTASEKPSAWNSGPNSPRGDILVRISLSFTKNGTSISFI